MFFIDTTKFSSSECKEKLVFTLLSREKIRRDHGVGSTDHFLKFLYYTSFLTPHDPTSKFST